MLLIIFIINIFVIVICWQIMLSVFRDMLEMWSEQGIQVVAWTVNHKEAKEFFRDCLDCPIITDCVLSESVWNEQMWIVGKFTTVQPVNCQTLFLRGLIFDENFLSICWGISLDREQKLWDCTQRDNIWIRINEKISIYSCKM